jgi:hypothetical protein
MPITTLTKARKAYVYLPYKLVFIELETSTLVIEFVVVEIIANREIVIVDRLGVKHAFTVDQVTVVTSVE